MSIFADTTATTGTITTGGTVWGGGGNSMGGISQGLGQGLAISAGTSPAKTDPETKARQAAAKRIADINNIVRKGKFLEHERKAIDLKLRIIELQEAYKSIYEILM